jgi:nucleotide-binding universal stress UspA family protein
VADRVVRLAPCDVVLFKFVGKDVPSTVLLPSAGGPNARLAARMLGPIAQDLGFTVTGMHVVGPDATEEQRSLVSRLEELPRRELPELLDWAETYRGPRAIAASQVGEFLGTASAWLRQRVAEAAEAGRRDLRRELDAFATLKACRKSLVQRNANPQMVAERALLALRDATIR